MLTIVQISNTNSKSKNTLAILIATICNKTVCGLTCMCLQAFEVQRSPVKSIKIVFHMTGLSKLIGSKIIIAT